MAALAPLEITALAKIIDELDYYQVLRVDREATTTEIKKAYYDGSRAFHPDSNRSLAREVRSQCEQISKRVTEAYCVLRDPRRRKAYDERLGASARSPGSAVRMQLAEARAIHKRSETLERCGRTPQGRQFYQKALQEQERGNARGALQHLQMALTFEPDNQGFKDRVEDLRSRS